jgi:hypothetical protein
VISDYPIASQTTQLTSSTIGVAQVTLGLAVSVSTVRFENLQIRATPIFRADAGEMNHRGNVSEQRNPGRPSSQIFPSRFTK